MENILVNQTHKARRRKRGGLARRLLSGTIITFLILLGVLIAALPFVWMTVSSLGGADMAINVGFSWAMFNPLNWTLEPYRIAWRVAGLAKYTLNTLIYAVLVTALSTLTSTLSGYAFGRLKFPGRDALFSLTLSTMMIPSAVTMIPLFITMLHVPLVGGNNILGMGGRGLYNTMAGLVIPNMVSATSIFLCRQIFQTLPSELEDAARIDGCNVVGIWYRVIMPLSAMGLSPIRANPCDGAPRRSMVRACEDCPYLPSNVADTLKIWAKVTAPCPPRP